MMNDIQKEKARFILMHYGAENQRRMLIEECAELIQAINKYERAIHDKSNRDAVIEARNNVISEIADVLIMIEQVSILLTDDDKIFIEKMITYKLNRQLNRIKKENEL